jgi:hypothetical protein
MQSMRSIVRDMNKNDDHVLRSDIASFINAGAGTVSAAQGIAKTLQGAEKVAVKSAGFGGAARNVGSRSLQKIADEKLFIGAIERFGVRAGTVLTVPYLGEVLLAIDVITTLWAIYEESNKDNVYQIWVKLAGLSNAK